MREPPRRHPERIVCIGVNNPDRNAEHRDIAGGGQRSSVLLRYPPLLVSHGEALLRPPESVLVPGDPIVSGTTTGAGARFDPPR